MSDKHVSPEALSSIPEITKPTFKSNIPSHLLDNANDAEKYILNTLSVLQQQSDWQSERLEDVWREVRKTNGRVRAVEAWKIDQAATQLLDDVVRSEVRELIKWKAKLTTTVKVLGTLWLGLVAFLTLTSQTVQAWLTITGK